jgi:hypothetical protein
MNTMNMPGFTAEASLYKASERYSMARTVDAMANDQKILPQRIRICGHIDAECLSGCVAGGGGTRLSVCLLRNMELRRRSR